MFLCFIDYSKAFDTVAHNILWCVMKNMGFPIHIIQLLKPLYDQQKAAVRTSYGLTECFDIEQGVRQGCTISPHLFNIYAEDIMRNALEDFEGSITVVGCTVTNLRYADDVVLIAGSLDELQNLVNRVKLESEKAGLFLNIKKTKVMRIQSTPTENGITIGDNVENVDKFTYLGATLTNTVEDSIEIKKESALQQLHFPTSGRGITLKTKIRPLKTMVIFIIFYGSECWVLKSTDRQSL